MPNWTELTEVDRLHRRIDFYVCRMEALSALQAKLPEPYRTALCDVLANGSSRYDDTVWHPQGLPVPAAGEGESLTREFAGALNMYLETK